MNATVTIDPEFKALIPPLTPDERKQLEANILADGCLDSIKTWNGIILDGHNRYEICTAHGLDFRTEDLTLESREDAVIWICKNQIGRRNITQNQRNYLMGVQYAAEKRVEKFHGNQYVDGGGQNVQHQTRKEQQAGTAGKIGKDYGVDGRTVRRNERFAHGVDAIGAIDPELKSDILTGKTATPKSDVRNIAALPEPERPAAIEKIKRGERIEKKPEECREAVPVDFAAIAHTIDGIFSECIGTLDTQIDACRDFIDQDPDSIAAIFQKYINILTDMKKGLQ